MRIFLFLALLACHAQGGVKPRLSSAARVELDALLAAGMPPAAAQAAVEEALAAHRLGLGWSPAALRAIAQAMGVRLLAGVDALPTNLLANALNEYSKLPLTVIQRLRERRKAMDIVTGRLSNHPALAHLRGGNVERSTNGDGWDDLPAVGANGDYRTTGEHPTVLVLGRPQGERSVNVILHEMGHSFDMYYHEARLTPDYSSSAAFQEVYQSAPWNRFYEEYQRAYHRDHADEHFAEQFARYFHSDQSRERMRVVHPDTHTYFQRVFPE